MYSLSLHRKVPSPWFRELLTTCLPLAEVTMQTNVCRVSTRDGQSSVRTASPPGSLLALLRKGTPSSQLLASPVPPHKAVASTNTFQENVCGLCHLPDVRLLPGQRQKEPGTGGEDRDPSQWGSP